MNKTTFSELEINLDINRVLDEMGFTNPTDIQNKAIPAIRSGVDVIGKSQTGTGKTIAFAKMCIRDRCRLFGYAWILYRFVQKHK